MCLSVLAGRVRLLLEVAFMARFRVRGQADRTNGTGGTTELKWKHVLSKQKLERFSATRADANPTLQRSMSADAQGDPPKQRIYKVLVANLKLVLGFVKLKEDITSEQKVPSLLGNI